MINENSQTIVRRSITIKSRLRLTIFIVVVLTFLFATLSIFLLKGNAQAIPEYYLSWSVSEGDTLWGIARESLPKGRDIRDYINEIHEWNMLETANIIEGQILEVPIYENSHPNEASALGIID
ncbi:MAG: LysM peptidoglycan-binding domain-containing protein [Clostridiales bacterium]|nr:LysM peptidoglycan-binding domain-containing protein [Clostridiales bacterium]